MRIPLDVAARVHVVRNPTALPNSLEVTRQVIMSSQAFMVNLSNFTHRLIKLTKAIKAFLGLFCKFLLYWTDRIQYIMFIFGTLIDHSKGQPT